ncbi:hypothetical protein DICVIV_13962 [Dictyocaulus viviparus]|uniref:Uncharacterized protein n=1 Tax=Dictyocaulus viviparus TaxID=29172 RepID=A0A0D8X6D8_DICVI|nr:hypothetical protein DICVIV_13962 [Dictyocaulus viviparus]
MRSHMQSNISMKKSDYFVANEMSSRYDRDFSNERNITERVFHWRKEEKSQLNDVRQLEERLNELERQMLQIENELSHGGRREAAYNGIRRVLGSKENFALRNQNIALWRYIHDVMDENKFLKDACIQKEIIRTTLEMEKNKLRSDLVLHTTIQDDLRQAAKEFGLKTPSVRLH